MPRKKNQALKIIGISLLIIFLLATLSSVVYFGVRKETGFGFGGTIISLQRTDFISSDSQIDGEAWLLTIVQNEASQFARGFFTADEINSKTSTKEKVKYPLEVNIESTPQKCIYELNAQSSKIYTMESISKGKFILKTSCQNACEGYYAYTCKPTLFITGFDAYCYKKSPTATYGSVQFDKLSFSSNIIANINKEEFKGTISNENDKSVTLADGKFYASWVGNLVSGESCPSSSEQNVASVFYNDKWKLIDKNNFIQYQNHDASGFENCLDRYAQGSETPQTCVSAYNSMSSLALSPKEFQAVGGTTAIQNAESANNGKVEITLGKAIQFPTITMRIKADLLGIVVPSSQPKIMKSDSECFTTGSNGFIVANIKNVGDDYATFVVSANCPAPFSQTGTSVSVQLAPNTEQAVNIPISVEAGQDVKRKCTINVADLENPSKKDSSSVDVCGKTIILCNSGETKCYGAIRQRCNAQGSGWENIEGDETCRTEGGGGGECKHYLQIGKSVIIPKLSCFREFKTIRWIASFLVGTLVLFLAYGATSSRMRNQQGDVENPALAWITAVIFGVGSAVITYMLFYVGLTILLIALLVGIIMRVKKHA